MKKYYKRLFIIITIIIFSLPIIYYGVNYKKTSKKNLHTFLYNYYFPIEDNFSLKYKILREFYKEVSWYKIINNNYLMSLLSDFEKIINNIPEELKDKYPNLNANIIINLNYREMENLLYELKKFSSNESKNTLFKISNTWKYLAYSSPLANDLAGYNEKIWSKVKFNITFPESILQKSGNEIILKNKKEIDYLIIGSGPAASVIAHELIKNKKNINIVMVETGSFVVPKSTYTESDSSLMESFNTRMTKSGITIRNAQTIGGGSVVNLDLAFSPLLPDVKNKISLWIDKHGFRSDLIHKSKNDWFHVKNSYDWVINNFKTREVKEEEVNANNIILLKGSPNAEKYHLNAREPDPNDLNKILKISSTEILIMPALLDQTDSKFAVISDLKAEEIIFKNSNDGKFADHVRFIAQKPKKDVNIINDINSLELEEQKEYIIKAKNIIVSAGTLGSAELMLKSNLKNDNIGKGIIIHPAFGTVGIFDKKIDAFKGLSASVYASYYKEGYILEALSAPPSDVALIHPGNGFDILNGIRKYEFMGGFGIMLVDEVNFFNKIYINKNNKVEIIYSLSDIDKEKLKNAIKKSVEILFSQGAKYVFISSYEDNFNKNGSEIYITEEKIDKIDSLEFIDNYNLITSAHFQGSLKIGKSSINSVISPNFRVWDDTSLNREINNLYVCDSSVFPTSVGANPMQSIYTIAKIFTDKILIEGNYISFNP